MVIQLLLFILGLAILSGGADLLVRGSSRLAMALGISPFVVGATIVAYGTSMPELMVSSVASFKGASPIALGNVIGSNLFNTGLILGFVAVIFPIHINRKTIRLETPFNIGLTLVLALFFLRSAILPWQGILLLALFACYILVTTKNELANRKKRLDENEEKPEHVSGRKYVLFGFYILLGIAGLFLGAQIMVDAAVDMARAVGISERIIGLTLVAFGTSLPELAASVAAAWKNHSDLVLGNLLGSNIFNLGLILGTSATIRTIPLAGQGNEMDLGFLIINALMIGLFLKTGDRITRTEGTVLMGFYVLFAVALALF